MKIPNIDNWREIDSWHIIRLSVFSFEISFLFIFGFLFHFRSEKKVAKNDSKMQSNVERKLKK